MNFCQWQCLNYPLYRYQINHIKVYRSYNKSLLFPLFSQLHTNHNCYIQHSLPSNPNHESINTNTSATQPSHTKSYYQRPLPSNLISFTSNTGKQLFIDSMNAGYMNNYFILANQYVTQNEPSYCGPATLSMCLNALQLDPQRIWKGVWRWWNESMLQTCNYNIDYTIKTNDDNGLSFEQFLLLAECNGARVEAIRSNYTTINNFRHNMITACRNTDIICVVAFDRKSLGQTGSGHFSPIAGYHHDSDRVLILDVARFKYPAYWVSIHELWQSMNVIDNSTGLCRGYFLMSRADNRKHNHHHVSDNVFTPLNNVCQVSIDRTAWDNLSSYFCQQLSDILTSSNEGLTTPAHIFGEILYTLPVDISTIFTKYSFDLAGRMSDCNTCNNTGNRLNVDNTDNHMPFGSGIDNTPTYYESYKSMLHDQSDTTTDNTHTHTHHHPHTRASIYSLLPLLKQINSTKLYQYLDQHIKIIISDHTNNNNNNNSTTTMPGSTSNPSVVTVPMKYSLVSGLAKQTNEFHTIELELTALLLYACPEQIFGNLSNQLQLHINQLRDINELPLQLKCEIQNLRTQLGILSDYCSCSLYHHNNDSHSHGINTNQTNEHEQHSTTTTNKRPHRFVSHTKYKRKLNTNNHVHSNVMSTM